MFGWIKDGKYFKFEKESQILRMGGGSWTVSLGEITEKPIKQIIYYTPSHTYHIDFPLAVEKGFMREFRGEPKLVIPLKYWTKK